MKKEPPVAGSSVSVRNELKSAIVEALVEWFRVNQRTLPWRGGSPYAVWVSEIMLQQTQVATVIPFFLRFMQRFPTIESLAAAPIDGVLQHWAGLGYYARARNLHRAAQLVVGMHNGRLPSDPDLIEKLPGIGRYTSGAILSIAYNVPRPLVDGNVIRVLSRVFGLRGDPKSTSSQAVLWSLAEQLVPETDPGEFNQGLMELGALICRPEEPLCEQCPLLPHCIAGNLPDPTIYPEMPPGRATVSVTHAAIVIATYHTQAGDCRLPNADCRTLLVVQRPLHGLWGGLWEFPRVVCEKGESPADAAVRAAREVAGMEVALAERLSVIKHTVTHHRITLHGYLAEWPGAQDVPPTGTNMSAKWMTVEDLDDLAFSAPQALLRDAVKQRFTEDRSSAQQSILDFD